MLIRLHMWPVKSERAYTKDANQSAHVKSKRAINKDTNQTAHVTS